MRRGRRVPDGPPPSAQHDREQEARHDRADRHHGEHAEEKHDDAEGAIGQAPISQSRVK